MSAPLFPKTIDRTPDEAKFRLSLVRELQKLASKVRLLQENRINIQFQAPSPTGVKGVPGDVIRNSAPSYTLSGVTGYILHGWECADEGSGTLSWYPMKLYQSDEVGTGGGGGTTLSATHTSTASGTVSSYAPPYSGSATNVGAGIGLYISESAKTLQFRTLKGGTDITVSQSGDEVVIGSTYANPLSITHTVLASRPAIASVTAGTLFLPKDAARGKFLYQAQDGVWVPYGPMSRLDPVPATSWSWADGNASVTYTFAQGTLYCTNLNSRGAFGVRNLLRANDVSGTGPLKITARIAGGWWAQTTQGIGISLWNNTTKNAANFWIAQTITTPVFTLTADKRQSGSANSTYFTRGFNYNPFYGIWLQIEHDASRRYYRVSHDGVFWDKIGSVTFSDWVGTVDQVGLYMQNSPTSFTYNQTLALESWKQE